MSTFFCPHCSEIIEHLNLRYDATVDGTLNLEEEHFDENQSELNDLESSECPLCDRTLHENDVLIALENIEPTIENSITISEYNRNRHNSSYSPPPTTPNNDNALYSENPVIHTSQNYITPKREMDSFARWSNDKANKFIVCPKCKNHLIVDSDIMEKIKCPFCNKITILTNHLIASI